MGDVYVVNHSGHNIRNAKRYGNIRLLSEGRVNIFATDRITAEFNFALGDFGEDDYILLCGAPILNVLAVVCALKKTPVVRVLVYNAKTATYDVRKITLEEDEECQKSWKSLSDIDNSEMKLMLELPSSLQ